MFQHNALEVSEKIKFYAREILLDAIRRGIVQRSHICECCGKAAGDRVLDAHHTDYYRPLEVKWVCRSCHLKMHPNHYQRRANGASKLQQALDWLQANPGNLNVPSRDIASLVGVSHMTVNKAQRIMRKQVQP